MAQAQGVSLPGMRRMLRGELDWVVLKAMSHDRNGRYASAAEMGEDLQRFLDGRPLLAVPASRGYVWGKFARRHRGALVAASLVACALIGGLALSLYGLQQAREQRAVAEQRSIELGKVSAFQQSMLEDVDIEAMGLGMANDLRGQVAQADPADTAALEQALGHASTTDLARGLIERNILAGAEQAIARDFAGEPALAADLRESVARVRNALGLYAEAAEGFRQVADYHAGVSGPMAATTLEARREQANALLNAAKPKDAIAVLDKAMAAAPTLLPDDRIHLGMELVQSDAIAALGDRPRALRMQREIHARALAAYGERDELSHAGRSKPGRDPGAFRRDQGRARTHGKTGAAEHGGVRRRQTRTPCSPSAAWPACARWMATSRAPSSCSARLVATQIRRLGNEHPATLSCARQPGQHADGFGACEGSLAGRTGGGRGAHACAGSGQSADPACDAEPVVVVRAAGGLQVRAGIAAEGHRCAHPRAWSEAPGYPLHHDQPRRDAGAGRAARTALKELQRVLPLAREVLEPGHPQLQAALMIVAHASEDVDDSVNEIGAYRELLEMRRAKLGDEDPKTIETAWQLGEALDYYGKREEGAALRKRYVTPLLEADPAKLDPAKSKLAEHIRQSDKENAS